MKKFATFLLSVIACCGLTIGLAGCKDDAPTSPTLSTSDTPSDATSGETGDAENDGAEDNSGNEGNEGTEDEGIEWIATEGLKYTLSEDESYYIVSGIGTVKDKDVVIPDTYNEKPVKEIGEKAFMACSNLTTVKIPDSITAIGSSAFQGCDNLENIHIKDIAKWCAIDFAEMYSNPLVFDATEVILFKKLYLNNKVVRDLVIPEGVSTIGAYAFCFCVQLRNITLPDSLTSIGTCAFDSCTITSITIPANINSIGEFAFKGCGQLVEVVNKSKLSITAGSSENGNVAYFAKQVITDKKDSKLIKQGDYLFYNNNGEYLLVSYVGTETDIVLPNAVENSNYAIRAYVFTGCFTLTSIEIRDGVIDIWGCAFMFCSNLRSLVIGDGVIQIGGFDSPLFLGCNNLTSVVIGNGVRWIDYDSFNGCDSLTKVYYKGTESEWKTIGKLGFDDDITSATRYYYSENPPTGDGNYWHYVDGEPTAW